MIEFEFEDKKDGELTFEMVMDNQFFVDGDGWLCQRCCSDTYYCIANNGGKPRSVEIVVDGYTPIQRILPRVTKIRF